MNNAFFSLEEWASEIWSVEIEFVIFVCMVIVSYTSHQIDLIQGEIAGSCQAAASPIEPNEEETKS